jgi:hypothetical protein
MPFNAMVSSFSQRHLSPARFSGCWIFCFAPLVYFRTSGADLTFSLRGGFYSHLTKRINRGSSEPHSVALELHSYQYQHASALPTGEGV